MLRLDNRKLPAAFTARYCIKVRNLERSMRPSSVESAIGPRTAAETVSCDRPPARWRLIAVASAHLLWVSGFPMRIRGRGMQLVI